MAKTMPPIESETFRYEVKFACPAGKQALLQAWIRSHRAGFRTAYPPRWVNNIYFDSYDWADLESNLAGVPERNKIRLRWYGHDFEAVQGVLELKQKDGAIGRKIRLPLQSTFDLTSITWRALLRDLRREDLGPLKPLIDNRDVPVIINRYRREYFLSADRLVRLTLDTDLSSYLQTFSPIPNLRRCEPGVALAVVEIKADASEGRRVSRVCSSLPSSVTAFSKYVSGSTGVARTL